MEIHRRKNHAVPQEDITFPAPDTLASPRPTKSAAQDTSYRIHIYEQIDFTIALKLNNHGDISNKLGNINLSTIPTQYKTIGDDWFASSPDTSVYVWDMRVMSLIHQLHGPKDCVYSLTFSPNSQQLYLAGLDHPVKRWEIGRNEVVKRACVNTMDGPLGRSHTFAHDFLFALTDLGIFF